MWSKWNVTFSLFVSMLALLGLPPTTDGFGMNLIQVAGVDESQIVCTVGLLRKYFHSGETLSGSLLSMTLTSASMHVQQALLKAIHADDEAWTIVVKHAGDETNYQMAAMPEQDMMGKSADATTKGVGAKTSSAILHEKPQCYFVVIENLEDDDLEIIFEDWKMTVNWNPMAQFVVFLASVEESDEEMTELMTEILLGFMNKKIFNVNVIGQNEENGYYYGKTVFPYHPDNNCGNRVITMETLDICDYQSKKDDDDVDYYGEDDEYDDDEGEGDNDEAYEDQEGGGNEDEGGGDGGDGGGGEDGDGEDADAGGGDQIDEGEGEDDDVGDEDTGGGDGDGDAGLSGENNSEGGAKAEEDDNGGGESDGDDGGEDNHNEEAPADGVDENNNNDGDQEDTERTDHDEVDDAQDATSHPQDGEDGVEWTSSERKKRQVSASAEEYIENENTMEQVDDPSDDPIVSISEGDDRSHTSTTDENENDLEVVVGAITTTEESSVFTRSYSVGSGSEREEGSLDKQADEDEPTTSDRSLADNGADGGERGEVDEDGKAGADSEVENEGPGGEESGAGDERDVAKVASDEEGTTIAVAGNADGDYDGAGVDNEVGDEEQGGDENGTTGTGDGDDGGGDEVDGGDEDATAGSGAEDGDDGAPDPDTTNNGNADDDGADVAEESGDDTEVDVEAPQTPGGTKVFIEEFYRALFLDKFPHDLSGCPLVAAYRPWEPYIFNELSANANTNEDAATTGISFNENNENGSEENSNNLGEGGADDDDDNWNDDESFTSQEAEESGRDVNDNGEEAGNRVRLSGIEYMMVEAIAERLHITIEMKVENNNLYHLFQMLIDGDIEMIVGGIDEDPSISQFVSSTIPYHQDDLTWCVAKAKRKHSLLNFLKSFRMGTWLLTVVFVVATAMTVLLAQRVLHVRLWRITGYFTTSVQVMGIVLSQSMPLRFVPFPLRITLAAAFFMGLMFNSLYQSFLVSTLTTPRSSGQIQRLAEVYQHRMTIMGSVDNVRHLNKDGEVFKYIREKFQMCYNIEECLNRAAHNEHIAVAVSRQHSFYNPRIPRDHLYCFDRDENLYVYLVTMLLPKKFHLLHKINPIIQYIIESGHLQKWARDLDMKRKIKDELHRVREEPFKSLTLAQIGGSFVFSGILLSGAVAVFALEHWTYWMVVRRRTRLKIPRRLHAHWRKS